MTNENIRRSDEPAFEAPWQARAFAIAVSLTDRGSDDGYPWEDFQRRLVEEIDIDGDAVEGTEEVYYEQWLRGLERMLVEKDLVSPDELAGRTSEFETGERDAAEFVIGEHGHTHDHEH